MPKRIKKIDLSTSRSSAINPTRLKPQGTSFSLKYYQDGHDKFSCQDKPVTYWMKLFERLKDLSGLITQDLLSNRSSSLRCHPIRWDDTSENSFGLPNEEQLVDMPYQFSLSSNKHGRVHGFFIDEIFYIVWLDPDHQLYDSNR